MLQRTATVDHLQQRWLRFVRAPVSGLVVSGLKQSEGVLQRNANVFEQNENLLRPAARFNKGPKWRNIMTSVCENNKLFKNGDNYPKHINS